MSETVRSCRQFSVAGTVCWVSLEICMVFFSRIVNWFNDSHSWRLLRAIFLFNISRGSAVDSTGGQIEPLCKECPEKSSQVIYSSCTPLLQFDYG